MRKKLKDYQITRVFEVTELAVFFKEHFGVDIKHYKDTDDYRKALLQSMDIDTLEEIQEHPELPHAVKGLVQEELDLRSKGQ